MESELKAIDAVVSVKRGMDQETKWMSIWAIIFPCRCTASPCVCAPHDPCKLKMLRNLSPFVLIFQGNKEGNTDLPSDSIPQTREFSALLSDFQALNQLILARTQCNLRDRLEYSLALQEALNQALLRLPEVFNRRFEQIDSPQRQHQLSHSAFSTANPGASQQRIDINLPHSVYDFQNPYYNLQTSDSGMNDPSSKYYNIWAYPGPSLNESSDVRTTRAFYSNAPGPATSFSCRPEVQNDSNKDGLPPLPPSVLLPVNTSSPQRNAEQPATTRLEPQQENLYACFSDVFRGHELDQTSSSFFDPLESQNEELGRDGFDEAHDEEHQFGLGGLGKLLDSTDQLEQENELPEAMASWKTKNDGNRFLLSREGRQ